MSPGDWPAFVGQPTGPTEVIDADIATVSGAADKVLRVHAAEPYLLHLEFLAGHDTAQLTGRLHVRNALLLHRHQLPVRSVAILMRPEADSPTVTGEWRCGFRNEAPYLTFRYSVIRIWQVPPEQILAGVSPRCHSRSGISSAGFPVDGGAGLPDDGLVTEALWTASPRWRCSPFASGRKPREGVPCTSGVQSRWRSGSPTSSPSSTLPGVSSFKSSTGQAQRQPASA